MLIVGVLCLCAAVVCAGSAVRSLTRPRSTDPTQRALRALAAPQLAAAVLLGAGGAIALAAGRSGLWLVIGAAAVAVVTVAVGSWQSARFALAQAEAESAAESAGSVAGGPLTRGKTPLDESAGCAGSCASCTLSCQ